MILPILPLQAIITHEFLFNIFAILGNTFSTYCSHFVPLSKVSLFKWIGVSSNFVYDKKVKEATSFDITFRYIDDVVPSDSL